MELYSLPEKASFADRVSGASRREKRRPIENEPRMLAVHDPRMLDIARSSLFCTRAETTTASYSKHSQHQHTTSTCTHHVRGHHSGTVDMDAEVDVTLHSPLPTPRRP